MFIQKVFAGAPVEVTLIDPLGGRFTTVSNIFDFITNIIIGIGWGLVVVMLALGFVQYITSRGEKTAVDSAQKWLTYAVIGGVGLFFIKFIKDTLPTLINPGSQGPVGDF